MKPTVEIFDDILNRIWILKLKKKSIKSWKSEYPLPNLPYKPKQPADYPISSPHFKAKNILPFYFGMIIPALVFSFFVFPENLIVATTVTSGMFSLLIVLRQYWKDVKKYDLKVEEKKQNHKNYLQELYSYEQKKIKYFQDFKLTLEKWENHPDYFSNSDIDTEIKELLTELYEHKSVLTEKQISNFNNFIKHNPVQDIRHIPTHQSNPKAPVKETKYYQNIDKIQSLDPQKRNEFVKLLKDVQKIQSSGMDSSNKTKEIKRILWTEQTPKSKLWIGAILGSLTGFAIFGTGGIGIVGLGSGIGIWGFLAGTTGGVLISSLIQNFEKSNTN